MTSLQTRVDALERKSGTGENIAVIIRRFGDGDPTAPISRVWYGTHSVERQADETQDQFSLRVSDMLNRYPGLIVAYSE